MRTDIAQPIRLKDYRPPDWLVETVSLDFSLHPTATRVRATLVLRPSPQAASAPLILDGDELSLVSLKLDGTELPSDSYVVTSDRLTIPQPPNGRFALEIETVVDPTANTQLSGLYRSKSSYCTQCEAEGFRRITYFPDRPDVMAVYTTRIEADKREAPVLLSNGNLEQRGELPNGRHFVVWHDPHPKPSYLFALVGGDLACVEDQFTTMSGRNVVLQIFVEHGKQQLTAYAMDSLKRAMRWDEQAFGREYDLDIFMIVAVSDFNMGAMENKGLNIFNDKYVLASPDTATDADFAHIEAVIAHEYFHNWTGNRITCRDWFQLCLKEGLTVFRDQEFSSDMRSRPVKRIADVRGLRATQFVEDAGPLAHSVRPDTYKEINNFYTTTIYEKGAELVRMVQTMIGREDFRAGMNLYFARHDGQAATVEQFIQCFADSSRRDLTQFMRWYSQAGTPEVTTRGHYDAARRTYTLNCKQIVPPTPGQPTKQPMVVPLSLGLVGKDGRDLPLKVSADGSIGGAVVILADAAATFEFVDVDEPPVLSINRGFSAPIKLINGLSADDLVFLAAHDRDPFNRWQAVQTISMRLLIDNVGALRSGQATRVDNQLIAALASIVEDPALEPAFIALALVPPGEGDIAREIGRDIDPDLIFRARSIFRSSVGERLRAALSTVHDRTQVAGGYSPDAKSAGRRALRNVAVDLLASTGQPGDIARASKQYETADNMTDRMAALGTLCLHDTPERQRALDHFYARYAADALVIDKWFALQATIPRPETLEKVRNLTTHPAFSLANPNRIRALIGAFAQGNATQFNRADGAGYNFIADIVLALDPKNPQVSARLATAFRTWRTLEPGRRTKAEAALARMKSNPGISRDLADIVERALAVS
ncbi:MAG TPA: aminopeptidase N [Pseudolabrys sp.]|nr:aminopeptidase N [Pseudolabrys sp.]